MTKDCERCHGTGSVIVENAIDERTETAPCPDCNGRGFVDNSDELQVQEPRQ